MRKLRLTAQMQNGGAGDEAQIREKQEEASSGTMKTRARRSL
jgi:hypothetical protein